MRKTVLALLLVAAAATQTVASPAATRQRPAFESTFFKPHTGDSDSWDETRWKAEYSYESGIGIHTVVLQYTVDADGSALYPSPSRPHGPDITGKLLGSGATAWLGLGGPSYSDFYQNADNPAFMSELLAQQEDTADELNTLYADRVAGWYVPQEVGDDLLSNPAKAAGAAAYYRNLVAYLHAHEGGRPVMASPFYRGGLLPPAPYASALATFFENSGTDVLAVQDGGGYGFSRQQISEYFSSIRSALGARTALWTNADMFDTTTGGGPMEPAKLVQDLASVAPVVSGYTGFSFSSQMGPLDLGTFKYYDAYLRYLNGGRSDPDGRISAEAPRRAR